MRRSARSTRRRRLRRRAGARCSRSSRDRTTRSSSASPRSSPTCARAATPRCSSTRAASTGSRRRRSRRSRSRRGRAAAALDALPADAARRARARPPRACATTTSAAEACGSAGATATPTARVLGQKVTPLDRVGIYVPGGKAAYPSSRADERDSGAGRRRRRDRHGRADAATASATRWCSPPRALAGVDRVFTIGGAQAIGALAYGTRRSRGRQDHRPGQRLCRQRQAARVRRGRHRHDRRAERDPGARRRHDAARLGGDGPVLAGRARRARAEHPALPGRRLHRRACSAAIERLLPAMPRRDDHPRVARRARRADPRRATWKRRARSPTASRPSTSRSRAREPAALGAAAAPRRRDLPRRATRARAWATTAPGRTTCCRPSRTARFSSPLGVYDFQKRSQPDRGQRARRARTLGPDRGRRSRTAKACRRMRARPSCGSKRGTPIDAAAPNAYAQASSARTSSAMHAYAIQPSDGLVKLDAMENPFRLPEALQRELGRAARRASRSTAIRRAASRDADRGAARAYVELPRGLQADARQRLGRADLAARAAPATSRARRSLAPVPGFVMYEMSARLQGLEFVGVPLTPTSSSTRRRCSPRSRRTGPALIYLAYPNNPTAQPVRRRARSSASSPRSAPGRPRRLRRGLPAVLVAHAGCRASARHPTRAGDAHAQQVRPGRRAPRLPGRRARR